jgi:geranylgeranyl diphosphate synthase type I
LIHDDVMDCSDTRRGEPSVHRRFAELHARRGWGGDPEAFGRSAAILLGDLALGWSTEMFAGCGVAPDRLAAAHPVYDEMRTEVMAGQYLDMLTQVGTGQPSRQRASQVARYKSAKYTIERPLHLGGRLAGAPEPLLAAYSGYGLPLGEAFQLRDDVLGVFGDPSETGKPAGDDLREGKRTYLVAAAWEAAGEPGRALLRDRLGDPSLDDAGVAALRALITETGALAITERRIRRLTEESLTALAAADLEPDAMLALRDLADAATVRVE